MSKNKITLKRFLKIYMHTKVCDESFVHKNLTANIQENTALSSINLICSFQYVMFLHLLHLINFNSFNRHFSEENFLKFPLVSKYINYTTFVFHSSEAIDKICKVRRENVFFHLWFMSHGLVKKETERQKSRLYISSFVGNPYRK